MKLAFSTKQKTKVAVLLFAIMICTLLVRLLEDKGIKEMGKAFASIYNDRLIPATDLFYISENLFIKQSLLESHFNAKQQKADALLLSRNLDQHNKAIDSLLVKYEGTFLVDIEKQHLAILRAKLDANRQLEKKLILNIENLPSSEVESIYQTSLKSSFFELARNVSDLTKIQSKVGEDLIKQAKEISSGSRFYSSIQFALSILIGVLIIAILSTSNVIKIKAEQFNLN